MQVYQHYALIYPLFKSYLYAAKQTTFLLMVTEGIYIRVLYTNIGYLNISIQDPIIQNNEARKKIIITIHKGLLHNTFSTYVTSCPYIKNIKLLYQIMMKNIFNISSENNIHPAETLNFFLSSFLYFYSFIYRKCMPIFF